MLVLSRHKDESIVIDGNIRVTVVDIRGDKVRIGIKAPGNVRIDREEVHELRMAEASSQYDLGGEA